MPYISIRTPTVDDAEVLSTLLSDYLLESYPGHTGTSTEQLRRDVLAPTATHHVLLAEVGAAAIGFAAWDAVYDMHWAVGGGQIADVYVATSHRGLGVALALVRVSLPKSGRLGVPFFAAAHMTGQALAGHTRESP
jgi:predicted N-acetyltransferase YhbS